jgi:hypothetical protein
LGANYFFLVCNKTKLAPIATTKRKTEATNDPPIPATYAVPVQKSPTETTMTKIQIKEIIKFTLSTIYT